MILRRSLLRSTQALQRRPRCVRCLATERDLLAIEQDIHNIQASLHRNSISAKNGPPDQQETGVQFVRQVDSRTQQLQELMNDGTKERLQGRKHQDKRTKQLGTSIAPHYEPFKLLTHPPSPSDITLELLLASQSHLGHKTTHWHPGNSQYIFGIRQGVHVISLDVTAAHLRRACRIVRQITERGGLVLFVGTRKGQERCVLKAAELAGGYHCFNRWMSGAITNRNEILGNCKLKAVDQYDRAIEDKGDRLKDQPALKPDLVVCLNPRENWVLLHECGLQMIPTIGIIDTDTNPTWVTYPIPANDDSLRCVQTIAGVLGRAGEEGQQRRKEAAMEGSVTYQPVDFTKGASPDKRKSDAVRNKELLELEPGLDDADDLKLEEIYDGQEQARAAELVAQNEQPHDDNPAVSNPIVSDEHIDAVQEPRSRSRAAKRSED